MMLFVCGYILGWVIPLILYLRMRGVCKELVVEAAEKKGKVSPHTIVKAMHRMGLIRYGS